jgi:ubiquinone biosynthesis protein COQ4
MSSTESVARADEYSNPDGIVPDQKSWLTVLKCWRGFILTGHHIDQVYFAYLAMQAAQYARSYYQVRSHPTGRILLRDKPDLLAVLRDDDYLASLPPGTVGHAYRSFLRSNRLDAGVFQENKTIRPLAEKYNWSDDFYYLMVRTTALHDMHHVLGGYGPDMAGEVATIGLHCGQMEPAGPLKKLGYLMAIFIPGASMRHKLRVYREALERGSRADLIVAAPWEELLDKPLDEVRGLLGVAPAEEAHPNGWWFTKWTPIGMPKPTRWDYDEILAEARADSVSTASVSA